MTGREEKQLLRHYKKLHIKTWQLVGLFFIFLILSTYFLRQNNLKMVELRNTVIVADEQALDVAAALEALNEHVFHHMNTTIVRPIELVHTYNRQAKTAIEAANQSRGRDIYAEATAACERRGVPTTSIAQCAANYALENNPGTTQQQINLPDKSRFTYTFATPKWTPDLAGFSVLITGVLLIWLLFRLIEYILVRLVIRRRLKNNF